ncbi:MAG: hypothetical protein Q7T20_01690, partial [Saprospiraceae bacterium]|nr:hypothetical protein [Saprospiraceae bacterium]
MASLAPYQGSLGQQKAAHLLRRTSFRYTKQHIDQLASMNVDQAVNDLLVIKPLELDQPLYDDQGTTGVVEQIKWLWPTGLPLP